MKNSLLVIILSLFFIFPSFSVWAKSTSRELVNLDKVLNKDYSLSRSLRLDSIRRTNLDKPHEWKGFYELASQYANFNTDSALYYATLCRGTATTPEEQMKSAIQLASLYNSSLMMYKEAYEIFSNINPSVLKEEEKNDYFTLGVQLYRNLEQLSADDSLRRVYARSKHIFRDSVLKRDGDAKFIRANDLLDTGNPDGALRIFQKDIANPSYSPSNGAFYHLIARIYERKGDVDKQIKYLAMAAKADIENGVREYLALPQLAVLLYEQDDIDRAYRYMQRSIADAKACNARVRMFDMSEAVPVISEAYSERRQSQQILLEILLVLVGFLFCITAVSLIYARRHNRMLSFARSELEKNNKELEDARNVREKYVRRFMNLSREYLAFLNSYRAQLFKIASKRNFDTLFSAIKSSQIIDRTATTFYANFDKAFLELYPDFVSEFNSMLRPEERIELKEEGSLNTELRIFALMKLGITESSEIAKFLNCSQSTVYNYRTRYRGKAIDKDAFLACFFG